MYGSSPKPTPKPMPISSTKKAATEVATKKASAAVAAKKNFNLKSVSSIPKSGKVPAGYFKGFNGAQGIDPNSPKG
jgi:hypothetical protein